MNTVRFGILGPGTIARGFAEGIRQTEGAVLRAVASRDYGKAIGFANEFDAEIAYGSYEELVLDPAVDICYVSVVHPYHAALAKLCLEHDKPVIVEKPFTINGKQSAELISLAKERGLLLMEAMWFRYNPVSQQVKRWIEAGEIGEVRMVQAQFGYDGGEDRNRRHLNRELAGGALLDVGIYTLSLAGLVLGYRPEQVLSTVVLDPVTGVDRSFAALLQYGEAVAMLNASVVCSYENEARIYGTEGEILLREPFYDSPEAVLVRQDGTKGVYTRDMSIGGFHYEVAEAARCYREGLLCSPWQTWDETQAWMDMMDHMRSTWGMTYPGED